MNAWNDIELATWLYNASKIAGGFLKAVADSAFRADPANYAILRPALLTFKAKYPKYNDWPHQAAPQ